MGFTQILLEDIRIYMQDIEEVWSDPTKVWFKIGVQMKSQRILKFGIKLSIFWGRRTLPIPNNTYVFVGNIAIMAFDWFNPLYYWYQGWPKVWGGDPSAAITGLELLVFSAAQRCGAGWRALLCAGASGPTHSFGSFSMLRDQLEISLVSYWFQGSMLHTWKTLQDSPKLLSCQENKEARKQECLVFWARIWDKPRAYLWALRPTDAARFLGPLVEKERRRIDLTNKR